MEKSAQKGQLLFFLIDPVFDIITHQFKYNHIKHGGKKKFCFIIRKTHNKTCQGNQKQAILKINTVHAKTV